MDNNNGELSKRVIFTHNDKASRFVNRVRYLNSRNSENPNAIIEKSLYAEKVGVWAAIS